ncbi:MAG: hypothetical protein ABDH49_01470 [Candidatus Hydrothermales bacterium]
MRKIIVSLPFLAYYCVAPLNYDKAATNKGANFYFGAEGFYAKGTYTESSNCQTTIKDFKYYGGIVTGGAYYGFSKNVAIGAEASLGAGLYLEDSKGKFLPFNVGYSFLKLSFPFSDGILAFKAGPSFPSLVKIGVIVGVPNPEKSSFSYFWAYPLFNTFSISMQIKENLFLLIGFSQNKYGEEYDRSTNFNIGISVRR